MNKVTISDQARCVRVGTVSLISKALEGVAGQKLGENNKDKDNKTLEQQ